MASFVSALAFVPSVALNGNAIASICSEKPMKAMMPVGSKKAFLGRSEFKISFVKKNEPTFGVCVIASTAVETKVYDVEFIQDGKHHNLKAASTRALLDAAEDAGLEVPQSCRNGVCTSCAVRLVSGDVHTDAVVDPEFEAAKLILMCSSYARSNLVLENVKAEEAYALEFGNEYGSGKGFGY